MIDTHIHTPTNPPPQEEAEKKGNVEQEKADEERQKKKSEREARPVPSHLRGRDKIGMAPEGGNGDVDGNVVGSGNGDGDGYGDGEGGGGSVEAGGDAGDEIVESGEPDAITFFF